MEQLIELMRLDEPQPSTGTIYPVAVVAKGILVIEKRIQDYQGVLGECSPPPTNSATSIAADYRYGCIDLSRVSHIVKHVWIDRKTLMCKVRLLGKYAEMAKEMNMEFGAAVRATGLIEERKVCTAYTLITIDLLMPELETILVES